MSHFDPTLQVAFADPLDPAAIDEIGFTTGLDVQVVVADPAQVVAAVKEHYGEDEEDAAADGAAFDEILKEMGVDSSDDGKIEVEDMKIKVNEMFGTLDGDDPLGTVALRNEVAEIKKSLANHGIN